MPENNVSSKKTPPTIQLPSLGENKSVKCNGSHRSHDAKLPKRLLPYNVGARNLLLAAVIQYASAEQSSAENKALYTHVEWFNSTSLFIDAIIDMSAACHSAFLCLVYCVHWPARIFPFQSGQQEPLTPSGSKICMWRTEYIFNVATRNAPPSSIIQLHPDYRSLVVVCKEDVAPINHGLIL
ncbi:hypothetical protein OUZ56_019713 [Daphnia magna]|uniref:Uncharacterized protein n=1 Tax=Daphnia magna TaxID=35525 RepID=A0ABQ9ZDF4_9CRUS|nr:hypothetical protein OUZ56_019713 [Daphnia magna]